MTLRTHGQNPISKVKIDSSVVSSGCSLTKWIIDPVIGQNMSDILFNELFDWIHQEYCYLFPNSMRQYYMTCDDIIY